MLCERYAKKLLMCIDFMHQIWCEQERWPYFWVNWWAALMFSENLHSWQEFYTTTGGTGCALYQLIINLYFSGKSIKFGVKMIFFGGKFWLGVNSVLFSYKISFCEVRENTPKSYGIGLSPPPTENVQRNVTFFGDGLP